MAQPTELTVTTLSRSCRGCQCSGTRTDLWRMRGDHRAVRTDRVGAETTWWATDRTRLLRDEEIASGSISHAVALDSPHHCLYNELRIIPVRRDRMGYRAHPRLSLIHISEPTRRTPISYAVFCLKKKKK